MRKRARTALIISLVWLLTACAQPPKQPDDGPAPGPGSDPPAAKAPPQPSRAQPSPPQLPPASKPFDFRAAQAAVGQSLQREGIAVPGGQPPLYPVSLSPVPDGYRYMVLATGEDAYYLLAVTADSGSAWLLGQVGGVNTTKLWVQGEGSEVKVMSQKPFSASTVTYALTWDGEKLTVAQTRLSDSTADFYRARRALIEAGDIEAVIRTPIKDVLYPQNYPEFYEQPKAIVVLAHQKALEAYRRGDLAGALRLTDYGVRQYAQAFGEPLAPGSRPGLPVDFLVPIVNDHAFFLAESGKEAEAEPILRRVVAAAPDRTVAHLNLGDLLWNLGKKAEAKEHYQRYLDLLQENRGQAPPRVIERISQG